MEAECGMYVLFGASDQRIVIVNECDEACAYKNFENGKAQNECRRQR